MIAENVSGDQTVGSGGRTSTPVQGSGGFIAMPFVSSPSDPGSSAVNQNPFPVGGVPSWQPTSAFNGMTGQVGMTVDGVYRYTKEADQMTLPPLPQVSDFENWRQSVRELVVATFGLGLVAFEWIKKVEDKGADLAQLSDSTRPFVSIDLELKVALSLILTGDLVNKVRSMTEHLRKQGVTTTGRQVLWVIYHHYSMDKYLEQVYSYVDLVAVRFHGDAQLESFLNKWRDVANNMVETPSEMFLTQLFLEQIKQSTALQNEVTMYHQAGQGHPDRTYCFLCESAWKLVERWRCDTNKQEMFRDVTTLGGLPSGKGPQGKGNNGSCYFLEESWGVPSGWMSLCT